MKYFPTTRQSVEALEQSRESSAVAAMTMGPHSDGPALQALLQPYWANGDRIVKFVHNKAHYSVILLGCGVLLLYCPTVPDRHGREVFSGGEAVVDVAAGETHFVFCTVSGAVYSFGYGNRFGQLGDGSVWCALGNEPPEECSIPLLSYPTRLPHFGLQPLKDCEEQPLSGVQHGITEEDNFVTEVSCEKTECLLGSSTPSTSAAVAVAREPVVIVAVACGLEHSLLLSGRLNAVYSCGRGHLGQLGNPRTSPLQATFRSIRLLFGLPIKRIAAAGQHSFVLLRTGRLFGFGGNHAGQLGLGTTRHATVPTLVTFLPPLMSHMMPDPQSINDRLGVSRRRLLDAKTFGTLRAGYATYESTHFPLRATRLPEETNLNEPFVLAVWTCATTTVILTMQMEWLSCGMPVSQSWKRQGLGTRYDGYGALGRHLRNREEAYKFGIMHWTPALQRVIYAPVTRDIVRSNSEEGSGTDVAVAAPSPDAERDAAFHLWEDVEETLGRITCHCYPHATVVHILNRSTAGTAGGSELYMENGVCGRAYASGAAASGSDGSASAEPLQTFILPCRTRSALLLADTLERASVVAEDLDFCDNDDSLIMSLLPENRVLPLRDCVVTL